MTKSEKLKNHLKEGKRINKFEAFRLYGIEALPTAISKLSAKGMKIQSEEKYALNAMEQKVLCNEYFL